MKLFLIVSRERKYLIQAENRKEAYARFFLQVKRGQIGVGELGQIILCYSATEADPYPFRTVPTLWMMGLISSKIAIMSLKELLNITNKEARELLQETARADSWILDEIRKLEAMR